MNQRFLDALAEWNHGTLRGAQRRLCRALPVSESNVSGWVNGRFSPGEDKMAKMARLFGRPHKEIAAMFVPAAARNLDDLRLQIAALENRVTSLERRLAAREDSRRDVAARG